MLKFAPFIKQFIFYKHSNVFIICDDINIPWTNKHAWRLMHDCLRDRTIQISWFLIGEIIEVIQSYWIYKHDPLGTAGVLIWSPAKWNVSRIDTNTVTQIFGQSPLLGIGWSKVGTQSPDFERELYDLGQDHGVTRRAAELLKFIFDH